MEPIKFPETAPGLSMAKVGRWLKHVGEPVKSGEPLVQLESKTTSLELPSSADGILARIVVPPGQMAARGDVLGELAPTAASSGREAGATANATPAEATAPDAIQDATGKVTPIRMPQASNSMEEGTIVAWKVAPGDVVEVDQIICEIETDKSVIDYPAPFAGRLARIVADEGASVPVKEPIAFLADDDAALDAYLATHNPSTTAIPEADVAPTVNATVESTASTPRDTHEDLGERRINASPAARRIAAERGIDLASVGTGSGPGSRIQTGDLEHATIPIDGIPAGAVRKPMSRMRRAIAENMVASCRNIPHFYMRTTVDIEPVMVFYRNQRPKTGCWLSDIILLAVGRTMADFPAFRSQVHGTDLVEFPSANIGIAVGLDEGLVVPVVLGVDRMNIAQLVEHTRKLVKAARNGVVDNAGAATFSVSNMSGYGVEEFSAIINPPESGVLAVGAVRKQLVMRKGVVEPNRMMQMTLGADHRIIDGIVGARFLKRLKEIMQNPELLE